MLTYADVCSPRTSELNCDKAGVKLDAKGAVIVDEALKVSMHKP
jgi:pyruvate/2-oxoglutarate dehydrogenase complex dihydrolipoamide dehydrogenase (E3) component